MDADSLRAAQGPLKERYRSDPSSAKVPISATASFAEPGITATVGGWAGNVRAGLHPATGGDGSDACSGDMLLEAMLGCVGVTLRAVATSMGVDIAAARLDADSTFDARGTLGVDRSTPVGIGPVEVVALLDTDADDETLERLAKATERHCVVAQSLAVPVTLTVRRGDSA